MNAKGARAWIVVGLAVLAVAGCSAFKSKKPLLDSSAGMFDKAEVSYRVETARLNAPPRKAAEGQLVSYQPALENRLPDGTTANVQIIYPHPEKREGYARVVVRFERTNDPADAGRIRKWWQSTVSRWSDNDAECETWALDIPHNEFTKVVNDLHNTGFFTAYRTAAEGTQVQAKLDDAKLVSKSWRQVPQLDALIYRVRFEGKKIFGPPVKIDEAVDPFVAGQPTPNSVLAYRALEAQEGVAVISDKEEVAQRPAPLQIVRLPAVEGAPRYR